MRAVAWGFEQVLGTNVALGVILDRDFRCEEELTALKAQLAGHVSFAHVHGRKEIENYLLDPEALSRAVTRAVSDRARRGATGLATTVNVGELVAELTEQNREEWRGQYQARRVQFLARSGTDLATLNTETSRWFESKWRDTQARMAIVHGKNTLALLNGQLQTSYGVTLTPSRIVDAMHAADVPSELVELLHTLEGFRKGGANS